MKINLHSLYVDNISGTLENRAENRCMILQGKRGKLFCTYLMASGEGKHPVVIFCHGYPGNEENMDIAHALRRIGFHVMNFHYSGSWGSEGNFSFHNCLEDTEIVINYIYSDKSLMADSDNLFLFGQSMGGFITYHTLIKRKEIKAGVLAMPCDFGYMAKFSKENNEIKDLLIEILEEGVNWLTGTSTQALYEEAFEFSKNQTFEDLVDQINKPMLVLAGKLDTLCPPETMILPWVKKIPSNLMDYVEINTDHMFCDARCCVTQKVADYLNSKIEKKTVKYTVFVWL